MAAKVCLRCDWTGTTSSSACPRCGAPLYARGGAPPSAAPAPDGPGSDGPTRRLWRGWMATALVVAVAWAAFVTIQFLTPSTTPPHAPAPTGFHGYLVYAAPDEGEQRELEIMGSGDRYRPGRAGGSRPAPSALVSTYAVEDTWMGLTVPTGIGTSAATVLRSADYAGADAVELGEGQLVAWPDGGTYVSILHSDPAAGCRKHLQLTTESLVTPRLRAVVQPGCVRAREESGSCATGRSHCT